MQAGLDKLLRMPLSTKLLCLLLVVDVTFIALHVRYAETTWRFDLVEEGGYAEIFQHFKEGFLAFLLGLLALRRRTLLYLSWSLLFLYLWLDDTLQIHEKLGWVISEEFRERRYVRLLRQDLGLRSLTFQTFGELTVYIFFGLLLLVAIASAYYFSRNQAAREHSRYLLILLVVFALFGVFVDVVDILFERDSATRYILAIAEDGGELVVMSIIVWFGLLIVEQQGTSQQ